MSAKLKERAAAGYGGPVGSEREGAHAMVQAEY